MKNRKRTDNFRPRFEDDEKHDWTQIIGKLKKIGVKQALQLVTGKANNLSKKTQTYSGDTWQLEEEGTPIHTKEQLIEACKIDLDVWSIDSFSVSTWNQKSKTEGYSQLYSIRAKLSKKKTSSLDTFLKKLEKGLYKIPKCNIKPPKNRYDNHCAIINIYDAHLDKVTRATETGSFSDIGNNCRIFKEAFYRLLDKSGNPKQIIFPIGNDLFNVNGTSNTTKRGTPQTTVLHHVDAFEIILDLMIKVIDRAAKKAPILIPMIAGNHDTDAIHQLGLVLSRIYRDVDHVTIDYSRMPRKYIQYGKNMFMFEHGDGLKLNNIALTMAQEQSKMWHETKYRYCYLGHLHHTKTYQFQRTQDDIGVEVRHLRAISPKDEWHFKKGYIGIPKSAELVTASLDGRDYNINRISF